jgi:hypothetical protein
MATMFGLGAATGAVCVAEAAGAPPPADCVVTTVRTPHAAPLRPVPVSAHASALAGFDPGIGVRVAPIIAEPPSSTLVGRDNCTVKLLVIVTVAEAVLEELATLCAVTVTIAGLGKICGAVKFPFESTAPQANGQAVPDTDQRTAVSGWPPLDIVG